MGIVQGKLCALSGKQQIPHTIRAMRGWVRDDIIGDGAIATCWFGMTWCGGRSDLRRGGFPSVVQGLSFPPRRASLRVNRREDSVKTKAKGKADPSHHPRDARMGSLPSSGPFVPLGEQAGGHECGRRRDGAKLGVGRFVFTMSFRTGRILAVRGICCSLVWRFVGTSLWLRKPVGGEVVPTRVVALYQPQFPFAAPGFDLLFAGNGEADVAEHFVVYQAENAVALGESGKKAEAVLCKATFEVVGDASVEVSRAAGEDVDVVGLLHFGNVAERQAIPNTKTNSRSLTPSRNNGGTGSLPSSGPAG